MSRKKSRNIAPTAAIALLLMTSACGGNGGVGEEPGEPEAFTMRLGFFLTGPRMPFVLADLRGYYEEENLDVTVLEGEGTTVNARLVESGDILVGEGDTSGIVTLRDQGVNLRSIAVFGQRSPIAIVGWKSRGVNAPADLEGKTLGTTAGSSPQLLFPAFASGAGIDESAIQVVPLDPAAKFTAFLNEDVDAIDTFLTSAPPQYYANQDDFSTFLYSDYGLNVLSDGLFVTEQTFQEKGDVLQRFLRAVVRAWEECDADPMACAEEMTEFKDTADPALLVEQWNASIPLWYTDSSEGNPFGCTDESDREATVQALKDVGLLQGDVDPNEIYTNEMLPEC